MSAHVEEPLTTREKNHRLDRARRLLLRLTCMSVTKVALAAGFKTLSHFSELYCRRFGNRPSQEQWAALHS